MKDFPTDVKLNSNALYLTATNRLAQELSAKITAQHVQNNEQIWLVPAVFPLKTYLSKILHDVLDQAGDAATLISAQHSRLLWCENARQQPENESILDFNGVMRETYKSWAKCHLWGIDFAGNQSIDNEDWQLLQRWGATFESCLRTHQFIDENQFAAHLSQRIESVKSLVDEYDAIYILGFERLPATWQKLLDQLSDHGVSVHQFATLKSTQTCNTAIRTAYDNPHQEYAAVAQWAFDRVNDDSAQRLAIVVPNLNTHKAALARQLIKKFAPEEYLAGKWQLNQYFHFTVGDKFTEVPAIKGLFDLCRLGCSYPEFDVLSRVLRSSVFYSNATALAGRQRADLYLRKYTNKQATHSLVVATLRDCCADWADAYDSELRLAAGNDRISVADYLALLADIATRFGWLAWPQVESYTHQLLSQWFEQLDAFAIVGGTMKARTFAGWTQLLRLFLDGVTFLPKDEGQPVQIFGMLEGSLDEFDGVWLFDMSDATWPQPAAAAPFIPMRLQVERNMPGANSAQELEFAKNRLQEWRYSSSHCIASYSLANALGDSREASSLLRSWPQRESLLPAKQTGTPDFEIYDDNVAQPIQIDTQQPLKGGTALLGAIANCPFQAFAKFRLGLRHWDAPDEGVTSQDIGKANHLALQIAWERLENSDNLLKLDESVLQVFCHDVAQEVESQFVREFYTIDAVILVERERVARTLFNWLRFEQQNNRSPFSVIATEKSVSWTLSNFEFSFQIDRIDQTVDGDVLILDYKTRSPMSGKAMLSDDLEEWQLPLYLFATQQEAVALGYAEVGTAKCKIDGICHESFAEAGFFSIANAKNDSLASWDQLKTVWWNKLCELLDQYVSGYAAVSPKHPGKSCQWCDFKTLCRVEEQALEEMLEEGDA